MIAAIVPAKKTSVRVKNKNFKKFGRSCLLEYKIKCLKKVKNIDKIIVHSDSNLAKKIAEKNNVSFIMRQSYFASNKCSGSEFFKNLAETVNSQYIIYSPCTAPFIRKQTCEKIINFFLRNKKKYDSVMTINNLYHHMWFKNKPLNYKLNKSPNSQQLTPAQKITYGFSIIEREKMLKNKNVLGPKAFLWPVDEIEAVDIDTDYDFFVAEQILKYKKFEI